MNAANSPAIALELSLRPIGEGMVQTVNARDLHAGLEIGKDFSTWIKAQIDRARLVEGRDFVLAEVFPQTGGNPSAGGRPRLDYHLTLDAAKHVAMLSGTDRGFEVREYFIACEQRALNPAASVTRSDLARMILDAEAEIGQLKQTVAEQAPKVEALDRIAEADGTWCIRDAAKLLQIRPTDLRNLLLTQRWIYGRPGHSGWLAYQDRIQAGCLLHKVHTYTTQDGAERVTEQVRITAKGLAKLGELLKAKPEQAA